MKLLACRIIQFILIISAAFITFIAIPQKSQAKKSIASSPEGANITTNNLRSQPVHRSTRSVESVPASIIAGATSSVDFISTNATTFFNIQNLLVRTRQNTPTSRHTAKQTAAEKKKAEQLQQQQLLNFLEDPVSSSSSTNLLNVPIESNNAAGVSQEEDEIEDNQEEVAGETTTEVVLRI